MSTTLPNVRVYEPGRDITAEVTAAPVTIKRFVKIAGNRTGAGNLAITTAGAGERAFGVAADNAAVGKLVRVARGGVVKVTATGANRRRRRSAGRRGRHRDHESRRYRRGLCRDRRRRHP